MRFCFLFLVTFILGNIGLAQSGNDNLHEHQKCNRASIASRVDGASYYQYPSMNNYDVKYLKLNISVEPGSTFIAGTALTVAKVIQPLDSFNIELKNNMTVDSVYINGVRKNFTRGADFIFVPLIPALPIGSTVSALIYYNGTAANNVGVFAGTSSSTGLIYTASLSESYQAREWFPAKQILKDKIDSADIWVKTTGPNKVGSNGVLVAVVDSPNNKKQYQWKSRHMMSYYMPSFAAGNYLEYINYAKPAAMAPDSILIQHYIVNNDTYFNSVQVNLDKTPSFIEKYSELFGLYPFSDEKYGHCQANIGGGMEHQTMTTTGGFGSTLIAHELGHQWWGDHVTCATWNHIWVNEGFASYCEYLAIEKLPALFSTTNAASYMQSIHDNVMSQLTGSVYVPDASLFDEGRIFSGRLSYNKGSAIIHNLRFEMEDDTLFFQTLKNYQQQFKDSVATAEDFRHVAETTSGKNFADFFNQWYYGEGYPTFNMVFTMQATDSIILQVSQTVSAPGITPFFKGLYEFKITSAQGDTTVKAYVTFNGQQFKFKYNKIPNGIVVDPNNWVLNQTGTIINGGTILPVKLISFRGDAANCKARLTWRTTEEQDCKQYDLEYSTDGINFNAAASIGSNRSNTESSYQFTYAFGSSPGYFFRLKTINDDGTFFLSEVIYLNRDCIGSFSLDISPNPVSENINVTIIQPAVGNTTIRVINAGGALIYKEVKMLNAGENKFPLKLTKKLSKGVYILEAENEHVVFIKKFVKG
ncbi:MAG: M1 family aminopeptidase [Ferruginibacter sp.]